MASATRTPPTEGRRVGVPSPRPKGRGTYGTAHAAAGVEAPQLEKVREWYPITECFT